MNRRKFIQSSGLSIASILLYRQSWAAADNSSLNDLINYPNAVWAVVNNNTVQLKGSTNDWQHDHVHVQLVKKSGSVAVEIEAPNVELNGVTLVWDIAVKKHLTSFKRPVGTHLRRYFLAQTKRS